ncbi:uncharacterized protein LOC100301916 precursor [Acyrthosiphon pisum]|uniref:Uncharacterized protein n=1 Tax=Acyrthosiphon pisum TaxID=7029 RepID=C4WVT3_ACYPI|nr:uncharacterized protein LOC100301916 precursor [Acyrthosiphon pisum]BAH72003.1 hypothetical protein [Acyrthosiphon pisum]|eukprot:NP_001153885.1 uncharacterized protein LOC100301916 precursor [Acyrthosiphon pisum]
MVFFKQYLITLTCIVISVWITPVNTKNNSYVNLQTAHDACKNILSCAGFEDLQAAYITRVNYEENLKTNTKTLKTNVEKFLNSIKPKPTKENYMEIGLYFANTYVAFYNNASTVHPIDYFCQEHININTRGEEFLTKMK